MDEVILVNENDEQIGVLEKMEAHRKGVLHRAFSVFIFNERGQMLIQQRALNKYHSPGLWTNACCSHPRPGESNVDAAQRRLNEELGFSVSLQHAFSFTYKAAFDNGLTEFEFDHVYVGTYNGQVHANASEVMDHKFISTEELAEDVEANGDAYTAWFKLALPKLSEVLNPTR